MNQIRNPNADLSKVRIELPSDTINELLSLGVLHANQCRCLDQESKHQLWKLLLSSCL